MNRLLLIIALATSSSTAAPTYATSRPHSKNSDPECGGEYNPENEGHGNSQGYAHAYGHGNGNGNQDQGGNPKRRNVILMVSDGFGPASETFARQYHTAINNLPIDFKLPLDTILVGSSQTRSDDSFITDSASGATAFSCGFKTYNAAIAVRSDLSPCGTVLEAAKADGYLTGLVATSRITHATPASFASHVRERDDEFKIAEHYMAFENYTLGRTVDVLMGGGWCNFFPKSNQQSCRRDEKDLMEVAKKTSWSIGLDRPFFDALTPQNVKLPLLNLFTKGHMAYEIDRNATAEPSLKEMAEKTLNILATQVEKTNSKGFFAMIEGSKIDHAAHANDAKTHFGEIMAYQDTIAAVKKFVDANPGTILISVSDHETGGLSIALQQDAEVYPKYFWNPEVLNRQKESCEKVSKDLEKNRKSLGATTAAYADFSIKRVATGLGVEDLSETELAFLSRNVTADKLEYYLGNRISWRAQLGWSSHGHSAVDVNLYAYGNHAYDLAGQNINTDIGKFIEKYLQVDLKAVTKKLVDGASTLNLTPPKVVARRSLGHGHFHDSTLNGLNVFEHTDL